jgi:lysozyme
MISEYIYKHEGMKLKPYRCTAGKLSIGVGRNLDDNGIDLEEALYLLDNDIRECEADLKEIFPKEWDSLSENKKTALIDMRFQLGGTGFRKFKRLIEGVKTGNWTLAKFSIENSLYYKQVKSRAQDNIKLLEEG